MPSDDAIHAQALLNLVSDLPSNNAEMNYLSQPNSMSSLEDVRRSVRRRLEQVPTTNTQRGGPGGLEQPRIVEWVW